MVTHMQMHANAHADAHARLHKSTLSELHNVHAAGQMSATLRSTDCRDRCCSSHAVQPLDKLLQEEPGRQLGPGFKAEDLRDTASGVDA